MLITIEILRAIVNLHRNIKAMSIDIDRLESARKLRVKKLPNSAEYTQAWKSFNKFYNAETDGSERIRVINSIIHNMTEDQANNLLPVLSDAITFFTLLPPADTRKNPIHPNYRKQSQDDLNVVNDTTRPSVERVAYLASVLYQVRCNDTHGDKDADSQRDIDVIAWALNALNPILDSLF